MSAPAVAPSPQRAEEFVTLFDTGFLPIGLALYESLCAQAQPFRLSVVCMDDAVADHLRRLDLPHLRIVPLAELESPELLAVKPDRTRAEYCWTATPFTFDAVWRHVPDAPRVTYLDADLYFFDDPRVLLGELDESRKHVLITEHAYDPRYDRTADSGRFCVQFVTFDRSDAANRVRRWWQERCLEWCFARYEDGKFGDQKYLEQFPTLFGDDVHILQAAERTLAPWNVRYYTVEQGVREVPVFYHFHGFRLLKWNVVRMYRDYDVGPRGAQFYDTYRRTVARLRRTLRRAGIRTPAHALNPERLAWARRIQRMLNGSEKFALLRARGPGAGQAGE